MSVLHSVQTSSLPIQPPVQRIMGTLSSGVKWPAHEVDHSSPSSAEVKNDGAIPLLPCMSSWHGAQLIKHKDSFTFIPYELYYCLIFFLSILLKYFCVSFTEFIGMF
jgi:hypothetical protein